MADTSHQFNPMPRAGRDSLGDVNDWDAAARPTPGYGVTSAKQDPQRDHLQDLSDKIAAVRDYRNAVIADIMGLQKRADTLHALLNEIDKTIEGFEEALRMVREEG